MTSQTTQQDRIRRLNGQAGVLFSLIRDALKVIDTIEPQDSDEAGNLAELRQNMAAAITQHQWSDDCWSDYAETIRIDTDYCSRMAFMLERMIWDSRDAFEDACQLLDAYKAEMDRAWPQPPTFMGEPLIPLDVKLELIAKRKAQVLGAEVVK